MLRSLDRLDEAETALADAAASLDARSASDPELMRLGADTHNELARVAKRRWEIGTDPDAKRRALDDWIVEAERAYRLRSDVAESAGGDAEARRR